MSIRAAAQPTLEGLVVKLEPLSEAHFDAFCDAGSDESLWTWTTNVAFTRETMRTYVDAAFRERDAGVSMPFATMERESNRVVGSTRFGNIDLANRRVEIGWTWIARQWQRTAINTEAKYLMLSYAFEQLGCMRVELKTDALNERSRAAILRLGAREEGIFRKHMLTWNGRVRDTAWYSIVDDDWPAVKKRLEGYLAG